LDTVKKLQEENKDLLLNKVRLESALEDKLLGPVPQDQKPESAPEEAVEKPQEKSSPSRRKKQNASS
jgi:hypothetical protein